MTLRSADLLNHVYMDGVDDNIGFGSDASIQFSGEMTFQIITTGLEKTANNQELIGYNATSGYQLLQLRTNTLYNYYGGSIVSKPGTYARNQLRHSTAMLYDGVSIKLYQNAALLTSSVKSISPGYTGTMNTGTWKGHIHTLLLYDRALSTPELSYNMKHPYHPIRKGLVLCAGPSGVDGSELTDSSTNENHGAITGATTISQPQIANRLEST